MNSRSYRKRDIHSTKYTVFFVENAVTAAEFARIMRTIQFILATAIAAVGAGCVSQPTPVSVSPTPSARKPSDEHASTQAYITACDLVLLRALRQAAQMSTTAGRKDEMQDACDAVLAVSASPRASLVVVAEYREVTREWRRWCVDRTDWRSFARSVVAGTLAATIDSFGGGGIALSIVIAAETKDMHKKLEGESKIREVLARWNRQLASDGYTSGFWRNTPGAL
jgi:hypothetical protein